MDKKFVMMACSALVSLDAFRLHRCIDPSAAEYANAFRTESDGPILPQLEKNLQNI
jgi:hypothetical protein